MHEYQVKGISEDSSFLEILDILNEDPFTRGEEPTALDSDCREGVCGQCGIIINGAAHDPEITTTYQLHTRTFRDGDVITIEPRRADAFLLIKDLAVNRSALDRTTQADGYISVNIGTAPDAHVTPVLKQDADHALEAVTCIGCGACMAVCLDVSAMLSTLVKVTYLQLLPQGKSEDYRQIINMLNQTGEEGFSACSNIGECATVRPKQIPLGAIVTLNRQLGKAALRGT